VYGSRQCLVRDPRVWTSLVDLNFHLANFKNGLIAKLAAQVSVYYGESRGALRDASSEIRHIFPSVRGST
jgi:hypothetical protein